MKPNSRLCLSLFVSLFLLFGCAHLNVGKPGRVSTKDLAAEAAASLVGCYQQKDVERFMTLVSPKFLGGYGRFEEALAGRLAETESVTIDLVVKKVEEGRDRVIAETDWSGVVVGADGKKEELSGRSLLTFIRYDGNVLKLFSVSGDDVFLGAQPE
jgi:hypothetical protein